MTEALTEPLILCGENQTVTFQKSLTPMPVLQMVQEQLLIDFGLDW